ncbi:hypothetical protein BU24DRAFT_491755 [Aaosphaeria arxii CBS 175.79]|uniref:Transcription factor Iwr1 domain-containing protein n=1 Tax=Aaosphaeria arxii CBS 175.79 TaxID=1450172 RepID=A0A6A5XRI9_9PLEO|nr:uncharacterized protein BU24DRAFT_491755 [Aaosphaeria arxii CBS 175.79]KAF2015519.1 hypothetical protein BU24DRAFT_491755 [Aaosphaeria arxii CBS 175.79]
MSTNAPQTLSVMRKRNEAPVDSLVVEHNNKRFNNDLHPSSSTTSLKRKFDRDAEAQSSTAADDTPASADPGGKRLKGHTRNGTVIWRRIRVPHSAESRTLAAPPPQTPNRRFHVSHTDGKRVLVERPHVLEGNDDGKNVSQEGETIHQIPVPKPQPSPPLKRPGANTANRLKASQPSTPAKPKPIRLGPSEETIRQFEQFSEQVENEEIAKAAVGTPHRSPLKFKPTVPKLRYKDRHPEQFADAMDVDTDEYVYDTYVREIIMPDADGNIPEFEGTVGFIVLAEEDEEWWFGEDTSDKEFDTDDEDENAEDYYANDYPEDEMSSEDEFDRGAYNYFHGESDEEYDLADEVGDDDDKHFRAVAPKARTGYWGGLGEKD